MGDSRKFFQPANSLNEVLIDIGGSRGNWTLKDVITKFKYYNNHIIKITIEWNQEIFDLLI